MDVCETYTVQRGERNDSLAAVRTDAFQSTSHSSFCVTRINATLPIKSEIQPPVPPPSFDVKDLPPARSAEWNLVQQAAAGDRDAQARLFDMYFLKLSRAAYKLLQHKEDAEDVAQQTCVKALLHLHQFQGKASFSTWLTQIAVNETIVVLRRRRASRELPVREFAANDDEPFTLDVPDERRPNPEEQYFQQECADLLLHAVNRLKPRLREAVVYQESDLSPKEIAETLGISVAAAKSRVFQGRKRMRQVLERSMSHRPRPYPINMRPKMRCPEPMACSQRRSAI